MKTVSWNTLSLGFILLLSSCGIFKNRAEVSYPSTLVITDVTPARKQSDAFVPVVNKTVSKTPAMNSSTEAFSLRGKANQIKLYVREKAFSEKYCFLIDMSIPSGMKRFFVYDISKGSIVFSGLVSHGSCNEGFLTDAKFSNTPSGGCTSIGKYKVGNSYRGQYGKAYKLYGLESTNSNAFRRAIVLHGFSCMPDEEIYPRPACNSLGCTGVSYNFLTKISALIDQSDKPILLWIYN